MEIECTTDVEARFRTQDLSLKWKSECTDGRTYGMKSFYLSLNGNINVKCQYECHGWTDKFQLFQFSFSSVAYSQVVCPSVRRSGKKRDGQTDRQTQIRSEVILNVTDGTIQEQTCRTINITFSQHAMHARNAIQCAMQCNARNAIQCNAMQYNATCNAMQCNAM
jgi:hypothetical protein